MSITTNHEFYHHFIDQDVSSELNLTIFFCFISNCDMFIDSWVVVVNAKMMMMRMIGIDDSFDDQEEKDDDVVRLKWMMKGIHSVPWMYEFYHSYRGYLPQKHYVQYYPRLSWLRPR
jgi:hypothetical protein